MKTNQIIVVDLDGTLTLTDTLHESILGLVRKKPHFLFLLPFWLLKGIAFLKLKVSENYVLNVTTLPYNLPLINWLKKLKACGKKIVLCTAANKLIALAVSKHLNLFDDVISSDGNTNLKGINKRKILEKKFGYKGFDYAGNNETDLEVWSSACNAIVVNANTTLQKKASKVAIVSDTFTSQGIKFLDWISALRVYQWIKNLLLFVPVLAAHQLDNVQSLKILMLAFLSFSLCASSVYITNDLLDMGSDRKHPRKRHRPFASAKLSIKAGLVIIPLLIGLSILLGQMVGSKFLSILIIYLILTVTYSLVLKRFVLVDCIILATFYTIRIIAGAVALSTPLSFWLLAFSVFIFFSLALLKRYVELMVRAQARKNTVNERGYEVSDASLLQILGVSSGFISTLVVALYVQSKEVMVLYANPKMIWFMIPIILFWVSWVWLKAAREEMYDDPIIFAMKDKTSLIVLGLTVFIIFFATTGVKI